MTESMSIFSFEEPSQPKKKPWVVVDVDVRFGESVTERNVYYYDASKKVKVPPSLVERYKMTNDKDIIENYIGSKYIEELMDLARENGISDTYGGEYLDSAGDMELEDLSFSIVDTVPGTGARLAFEESQATAINLMRYFPAMFLTGTGGGCTAWSIEGETWDIYVTNGDLEAPLNSDTTVWVGAVDRASMHEYFVKQDISINEAIDVINDFLHRPDQYTVQASTHKVAFEEAGTLGALVPAWGALVDTRTQPPLWYGVVVARTEYENEISLWAYWGKSEQEAIDNYNMLSERIDVLAVRIKQIREASVGAPIRYLPTKDLNVVSHLKRAYPALSERLVFTEAM